MIRKVFLKEISLKKIKTLSVFFKNLPKLHAFFFPHLLCIRTLGLTDPLFMYNCVGLGLVAKHDCLIVESFFSLSAWI